MNPDLSSVSVPMGPEARHLSRGDGQWPQTFSIHEAANTNGTNNDQGQVPYHESFDKINPELGRRAQDKLRELHEHAQPRSARNSGDMDFSVPCPRNSDHGDSEDAEGNDKEEPETGDEHGP